MNTDESKKRNFVRSFALPLAVIVFGFAGVYFLSGFLERTRPALPENYADEDLALQGARLKGFSLGFEGLIADWYWMQSLQYLGEKIIQNPNVKTNLDNLNALNPRLLYPYLDNATTLDPRFLSVYEFGATVLPAVDKEQAIKLLEKGIVDNPNEWRLYQHLGYIYWRLGNFEKASEIYAAGAKIPNAPNFMQMMAAKTKTEGGNRDTARIIYRQIFDQAQDEQIKENARLRLLQLQSFDERDAVRAVLQIFKEKNNRCADSWHEILPLLQKLKLPNNEEFRVDKSDNLLDPTDSPYTLDKEKCEAQLNYSSTKIPAQ